MVLTRSFQDFSTDPPTLRNSVYCQKVPRNRDLLGLVQAQDPANDPDLFFDPASLATVKKGSQPNTTPFNIAHPLCVITTIDEAIPPIELRIALPLQWPRRPLKP